MILNLNEKSSKNTICCEPKKLQKNLKSKCIIDIKSQKFAWYYRLDLRKKWTFRGEFSKFFLRKNIRITRNLRGGVFWPTALKKLPREVFPVEVIVTVEADTPLVKRKVCPIAALLDVHGRTSSRRGASLHTSSYLHSLFFPVSCQVGFFEAWLKKHWKTNVSFLPSIIHTNIEFSRFELSVIV